MTILAGQRLTAQVWLDNTQRTIDGGYTAVTTTTTSASSTEVVMITSASLTLRNGRAYRVTVSFPFSITAGATGVGRVFVRRTGLGGSVLFDTQRIIPDSVGSTGRKTYQNICSNQTGADLVSAVVATISLSTGTGTVSNASTATSPSYLQIEDIGAATDYPTATSVT